MTNVSKPHTFSPSTAIASSQVNSNFDTLYNDYNGGISAANLASNAVTTAKIADSNVTTAKIADDAVTPAKWTNPYCFRAYDSGGTTLTDNTVVQINLATEVYDYNNNFASSAYTAPVSGVYHFDGAVSISGAVATGVTAIIYIYVDGSEHTRGPRFIPTGNDGAHISADILLTAGQAVTLRFLQDSAGGEATTTGSNLTWFSGHLVHAT